MSDTPQFVEFLESHRPPLKAGEYRIFVQQQFSENPEVDKLEELEPFGDQFYRFTVAGPKYVLSPQEIAAVFPPAGSLGDHSDVFPHVALRRSTLPWERSADAEPNADPRDWKEAPTPWLALLVYDEDDLKKDGLEDAPVRLATPLSGDSALKVGKLDASDDAGYPFHDAAHTDTVVAAVDLRSDLLKVFLPTAMECRLLCHVRRNILFSIPWIQGQEPTAADIRRIWPKEEQPLSDGATFERAGEQNCWRLTDADAAPRRSFLLWENAAENTLQVSDLEDAEYAFVIGNRLPKRGGTTTAHLISLEGRFDGAGGLTASAKKYSRFVSLHQWRFSCESHEHTFKGLLLHLNQTPATAGDATLRLPPNLDGATEMRLAAGFTLLPHQFRDGSQSYSWYRGPLAPGPTSVDALPLPAESSDALLAYDGTSGLFYAHYAAAWELGRLLCLANSRVSQALYQWKRGDRRLRRQSETEHAEQLRRLPVDVPDVAGRSLPRVVRDWFRSLRRLEPVPFRYLVPDERMLPVESIRFFEIDPHWIDSLIDGAFSIGRVLENDHEHDGLLHVKHSDELRHPQESGKRVTGLLLRSAVVSGWPLMSVDGVSGPTGENEVRHERLRFDRLAPDVLLCLFAGSPTRFEIHLPRETIHFGIDADEKGRFRHSRENKILMSLGISLKDRRLRLRGAPPSKLDPAQFALHMVEGVPKIVFERRIPG